MGLILRMKLVLSCPRRRLDVNRRTVFDCDNSDFAHMPVPFQNIIRLFANKHVRGRDLLQVVDKAE